MEIPAYRRFIILADGHFSLLGSKTANQAIRYIPDRVAGILDREHAGQTVCDVLGYGGTIPVHAALSDALHGHPDALLIGIAPTGGHFPEEWRPVVTEAILNGLDIVSGLHTFLSDDPGFTEIAGSHGVRITDLRKVSPEYNVVAGGMWKTRRIKTVLTVGTDCNSGKMTAAFEIHREFLRRKLRSGFIATGQTGILLAGKGIAIDSLAGDYISGAIEREIELSGGGSEVLLVEGQGSLTHQGYSAVTLGLLHGVMPDAMILVHPAARKTDAYGLPIGDLVRSVRLHEQVLAPFKPSKVVGCAINTVMMTASQISESKKKIARETGLPVADVLHGEAGILADALQEYFKPGQSIEPA